MDRSVSGRWLAWLWLVLAVYSVLGCPSAVPQPVFLTTDDGSPIYDMGTMTVGQTGPVLLEDVQTIERVMDLTKERVAPRRVHAQGGVAKGYFEVTNDIKHLTFADVFSTLGKRTDVIVRFSTVTGGAGSPEWLRDPRGFAVKFYTAQGNWDLLGLHVPVFFIRDAAQFPDIMHAFGPSPDTGLPEAWRTADILSFHPEAMNMVVHLFDDMGIPASYRNMNGSSINTFSLINAAGNLTLVRFHWLPLAGERSMLESEICADAAATPDGAIATRDLQRAILAGDFPQFNLFIQALDPAAMNSLGFYPLDATKFWPQELVPYQQVGRLVLNRITTNAFNEDAQLAFSPAHLVPGIGISDDKLLQMRLFAYRDAQSYRIGPNFGLLPVNAPRCPVSTYEQDGPMNFLNQSGDINYFPSSFAAQVTVKPYPHTELPVAAGLPTRADMPVQQDDFSQPGARYRFYDPQRQLRLATRIGELLTSPRVTPGIQARWMQYLMWVDRQLATQVSQASAGVLRVPGIANHSNSTVFPP